MPIEKLEAGSAESQTADLIGENIAKLKALFPELLTESGRGAAINIDVLKALVGDATTADGEEKYGLNWHGKRRARQIALTPSTGTYPALDHQREQERRANGTDHHQSVNAQVVVELLVHVLHVGPQVQPPHK